MCPALIAVDGGVHAFAFTASIRIMDECAIQGWLDQIHHRMVDYSITKRGGRYDSRLALIDLEQPVAARLIIAPKKLPLKAQQLNLEVKAKACHIGLAALAAPGFSIGQKQIFKACYFRPEAIQTFHS
jgi:hypothetical protein